MKVRFNKINLIILFVGLFGNTLAQNIWGPNTTDYRRDLHKDQYGTVYGGGLAQLNTQFIVGRESGPTIWRDVYQWNIPDEGIPDNSSIDFVRLVFNYADGSTSSDLFAGFYNISYDMTSEDYFTEIFNAMNYTVTPIGSLTGSNHNITFESSDPNSAFNQAIKDMLPNNKFVLGINWGNDTYDNNNNWYIQNISVTLYIEFTPPTKWVTIDQRNSLNQQIGILKKWEWDIVDWGNNFNPGSKFPFDVGSQQVIHGDQAIYSNEKYQKWIRNNSDDENVSNHHSFSITPFDNTLTSKFNPTQSGITIKNSIEGTSVSGAKIKFADPWYIDYADPDFGDSKRNRGMKLTGSDPDKLQYRERTSPFYPDYNTIYQNNDNGIQDPSHAYLGVFLNQGADWQPPYYSVQALSSQPVTLTGIGTRDFYFFSWDYDEDKISLKDPLYATTGVVFKQADATLTANLKGHLLSNNQNALSGGSQRRLVRTENGIYHLVYESMGVIWYTHSNSTNFNGSWSAEAGVEIGKNPSMDFNYNTVRIVCEKSDADSSIIELITIDPDYNNPPDYEYEDVIRFPLSYYGNAKPVISTGSVLTYIAYRKNVADGIHQVCRFYQGIWDDQIISGTNTDCMNPSIVGAGEDIHLVCANNSRIEYIFCYKKNAWEYHSPEYISDGSGNNANGNPCITLANGYPVVSWIGSYSSSGINKSTGEVGRDIPPMVVVRRRGSTWGSFFKSGSNVVSVNSNSSNNSTEQTVIAWSEGTPQSYTSNWVRRVDTAYSDPHNLSSNGVQTQVSNGTDLTDMGGVLLSTATTPYDLPLLTTDFNQLFLGGPGGTGKIKNQPDLAYGREGIISKNGVEFLFDIGDVIAGDSVIKFIYRPDTLSYASAEELNEVVRSESFPLDPSAEFYFTDFYYVLNPGAADTLLSGEDLVNFKAELVDAGSGSIAGSFDNVTYTKEQLDEHNNVSYRVDCSNITPGSYYLRLVTTVQGDAEFSLADVQNNADELAKHSYNEIVYDGSKLPETYDLSQNFPNPFNPATTINYQMPENGFVTLKIYDILGKEVETLVNEQKTQGRYLVNFDASRLASGVYIYQIRVNDYVSSKKMLLLK